MDPRTELRPAAAPPVRKQGLRQPAAAAPAVPVEAHSADTAPLPAETASGTRTEKVLAATSAAALWLRDSGLAVVGYLGVLVVCGYGWRTSFIGLHTFAMDHMGLSDDDAWGVPITFDGGAGVLTLVVARAAMNGRGAIVWRLGVLALTLLSSWINWVHIADPDGRQIASLLPIVAVGAFEGLLSEARKAHERRTGNVRPRLSLLRWVFDFTGTLSILRAYVLGIPLPDQMADAAKTIQAVPVSKPKTKRQQQRPSSQPKPKAPTGDLRVPEPPQLGSGNAEIINIELVRKYGDKSARAITLWLNSIEAGEELSLRKIDGLIQANGTAKFAIKKYVAEYGDPRKKAVNE